MDFHSPFTSLLIVVILAASVPLILFRFKRVSVPIVVGEIIAGILLGRSGLKLAVSGEPILDFLAELGLVFLMFLSGMEIDFSSLGLSDLGKRNGKKREPGPLQLGILSFLITLLFSAVMGWVLYKMDLVRDPWMMGLILSTTSLGVVVPVLKENGLIGGKYGQTLLIAALIADFATMILITVEVAILSKGLTLDVLLISVLFMAFIFVYRMFKLSFKRVKALRVALEELSSATAQIKVRMSIAIMLVFVVLAESLGTEVILGAFLAGVMISLLSTQADRDVSEQLETIGYGFIIPIFFIMVGVDLNFSALFASPKAILLVPLLLVAAVIVKLLSSLVFRLTFTVREALAGGVLLSSRLSLIIAAVAIGTRLNVISEAVNAAIILVAVITVTFSPLIFNRLIPRQPKAGQLPIVIAGGGPLATQVAEKLRAHNEIVTIIARDSERAKKLQELGYNVVKGNIVDRKPETAEVLKNAGSLVVTYTDTEVNYEICELGKKEYRVENVVAHVFDPNQISRFNDLGIRTMNASLDRAALLTMLVRNPATYELLTRTDDNKEILELQIENKRCFQKKLRELALPGDVRILAVKRNEAMIIPSGTTKLERGDVVTLIGSLECMDIARQMISGSCE